MGPDLAVFHFDGDGVKDVSYKTISHEPGTEFTSTTPRIHTQPTRQEEAEKTRLKAK
jgi:hypothetical protein